MARVCEVGKAFMKSKMRDLINQANGAPVLLHYSSDGTPLSTKHNVRVGSSSAKGFVAQRHGRSTEEYLVQHAFARRLDASGQAHTVALLRDPLPLTHGKGAWAMFNAGVEFFQTAREQGHLGISIAHYAFDRAAFVALQRTFHQRHAQLAPSSAAPGRPSQALELMEWLVSSGCALHDCHNSLKWALHQHFRDTDLMDDVYISIASVRNAHGLVIGHLGDWIKKVTHFLPESHLPPVAFLHDQWTVSGLEHDLVDLLAEGLRGQWKDDRLQVLDTCLQWPDLWEELSAAVLGVWQFRKFTTSRWVTVGCSCRSLIGALLTGFGSMFQFIKGDPWPLTTTSVGMPSWGRLARGLWPLQA